MGFIDEIVGNIVIEVVDVYEDFAVFVDFVLRGFVCDLVVELVDLSERIHYLVDLL